LPELAAGDLVAAAGDSVAAAGDLAFDLLATRGLVEDED